MNVSVLLEAVPDAVVDEGYGPVTVDVPADGWASAVESARVVLGCDFFDFLSAVDSPEGPAVVCHLVRTEPFGHVLLRARLDVSRPVVESVSPVYEGASWHERETAEMFGITFTVDSSPLSLEPLLLPPGMSGHPLRKDFVLQSRLDRPWPGAKEPGGS